MPKMNSATQDRVISQYKRRNTKTTNELNRKARKKSEKAPTGGHVWPSITFLMRELK